MGLYLDIRQRLTEIQGAIPGIKKAYAYSPDALPEGDFPLFVNFIGSGTHDQNTEGQHEVLIVRNFLMRLYIATVGQGYPSETEKTIETFLDLVPQSFYARPGLSSPLQPTPLGYVFRTRLLTDTGPSRLKFSSVDPTEYLGIDFTLRVELNETFEFASQE